MRLWLLHQVPASWWNKVRTGLTRIIASYVSCLMSYVPEGGTLAKRVHIFMEGQNMESLQGFLTYRI